MVNYYRGVAIRNKCKPAGVRCMMCKKISKYWNMHKPHHFHRKHQIFVCGAIPPRPSSNSGWTAGLLGVQVHPPTALWLRLWESKTRKRNRGIATNRLIDRKNTELEVSSVHCRLIRIFCAWVTTSWIIQHLSVPGQMCGSIWRTGIHCAVA